MFPIILPQRNGLAHGEWTKQSIGQPFLKFKIFSLLDVAVCHLIVNVAIVWIDAFCLFQIGSVRKEKEVT